jgi:hypothetical protein
MKRILCNLAPLALFSIGLLASSCIIVTSEDDNDDTNSTGGQKATGGSAGEPAESSTGGQQQGAGGASNDAAGGQAGASDGGSSASEAGAAGAAGSTPALASEGDLKKVELDFAEQEDLDLYVVDPLGNEIYWNNANVLYPTEGAHHHYDATWSCDTTEGDNGEEVVWDPGSAPRGEYTVRVKYYEHCSADTVAYTVTVTIGDTATEYSGAFAAAEEDKIVDVATFTLL